MAEAADGGSCEEFHGGQVLDGFAPGLAAEFDGDGHASFQSGNCEIEHKGSVFSFLHSPAQFLCHLNTEVRGLGLELVQNISGTSPSIPVRWMVRLCSVVLFSAFILLS